MTSQPGGLHISDDLGWRDRGLYWTRRSKPLRHERRIPIRYPRLSRPPLILTGHGARLTVERGALVIRNGYTHYPQKRDEWRLFPGEWRIPSRIILIDTHGSISMDVIQWLATHGVTLVFLNYRGECTVTVGGAGAIDPVLRHQQLAVAGTEHAYAIARTLVKRKVLASIEALLALHPPVSPAPFIRNMKGRLRDLERADDMRSIQLIEASAAHSYFAPLKFIPVKWDEKDIHRVPREWTRVGQRRSFLGFNRNATHPIQAMLNYAYAVLESRVRTEVVAAALDPKIGYLHTPTDGRDSLVLDLMEPRRPEVECVVLGLVKEHVFSLGDVALARNGVVRLHPQLARRVVQVVLRASSRVAVPGQPQVLPST